MNDVGATSVEQMIESYSAGAGFSGADPGSTAGLQPGDYTSHSYLQLRGFNTPTITRDGFMPLGGFYNPGGTGSAFTSNFDVDRVEVINGPQSLLYGSGGPGGVINTVSKQARLGQPAFGSVSFRLDQYGSKRGQIDYGAGNDNVAVRMSILHDDAQSRRVNVGGTLDGYYAQVAFKVFKKTIVRVSGEQTTYNRTDSSSLSLTASSTSADSRNGDALSYLLATNQIGANTLNAAGAPNGSGAILNGNVNWGNLNSYEGWLDSETDIDAFVTLTADSQWTDWLSTQFAIGYNSFKTDVFSSGATLYSPQSTSNTAGGWAIGGAPIDLQEPARNKAIRFSALATNDLFGGKAKSQTILGADFVRQDGRQTQYNYFQADSNFVPILSASATTYAGRTVLSTIQRTVNNGPIMYPLESPGAKEITVGGVNYVRGIENEVNPTLINPANPLGLTNGDTYEVSKNFNKGLFLINDTGWFNDKLDTIVGARYNQTFSEGQQAGDPDNQVSSKTVSFDVGADYELLSWLRPYVAASDSYDPPQIFGHDPVGNLAQISHGIGEEAGLKFKNPSNSISGSIAVYHTAGTNEQYEISSTIETDINPAGLNGKYGTSSQYLDVSRKSSGAQLIFTANPTSNWRIRAGASYIVGTTETSDTYEQLYNDQFNENSSGQITYADGTPVYVLPTYNSKTPTATSTTPGAIPLTISLLNNSASPYYANPTNPTGQINSGAAVATVLKTVDPVHGAILTGVTGLPISAIQITPPFSLPGQIVAAEAGDHSLGFPKVSGNITSVYTFSSGWIKGLELGGTVASEWDEALFYYYPQGYPQSQRTLYVAPVQATFNGIFGYSHKIGRISWDHSA